MLLLWGKCIRKLHKDEVWTESQDQLCNFNWIPSILFSFSNHINYSGVLPIDYSEHRFIFYVVVKWAVYLKETTHEKTSPTYKWCLLSVLSATLLLLVWERLILLLTVFFSKALCARPGQRRILGARGRTPPVFRVKITVLKTLNKKKMFFAYHQHKISVWEKIERQRD